VRSTQGIPFRTERRSFHGLPRPSLRGVGLEIRLSKIPHCVSVRSRPFATGIESTAKEDGWGRLVAAFG
jgi:hypothetical protein